MRVCMRGYALDMVHVDAYVHMNGSIRASISVQTFSFLQKSPAPRADHFSLFRAAFVVRIFTAFDTVALVGGSLGIGLLLLFFLD